MSNGTAVVTGIAGTSTLHSLTITGFANIRVRGIAAQAILHKAHGKGTATATITGIVTTGTVGTATGILEFRTTDVTGVRTVAAVGIVSVRGFNFKNYLSPYIYNQVPAYIREQYPQFVNFLTAYYRYLDTDSQPHDLLLNSSSWTDIDATLDAFVIKLQKQFAFNFSNKTIVDSRRFVKLVHEFYEAKGTEQSIELFFKLLYNDRVAVEYPSKLILKASDGRWKREISIKLNTVNYSGHKLYVYFAQRYTEAQGRANGYVFQIGNGTNPFDLINKIVDITFYETVPGEGTVHRRLPVNIIDVKQTLNPNIYDLTVEIDPLTEILDTALVEFDDEVYGTVTRQYLTYTVIDPGEGFRPGDVLYVNEEGFNGDYFADDYLENQDETQSDVYVSDNPLNNGILRVSEIDENGGIVTASIINTGYLFTQESFDISLNSINSTLPADISFTTGFIYQRPGLFTDASGLLSDVCKIQDNLFYQAYSYVIKSKIDPTEWKPSYLKTVHPAGVKLFSEYIITDTADLRSAFAATDDTRETLRSFANSVEMFDDISFDFQVVLDPDFVTSDFIFFTFDKVINTDTITATDAGAILSVGKGVTETVTTGDSLVSVIDFSRVVPESVASSDMIALDIGKPITDSAISNDTLAVAFSQASEDSTITDDTLIVFAVNKIAADTTTVSESAVLGYGKNPTDSISATEVLVRSVDKAITETATSSEVVSLAIQKPLSDTVTIIDNGTIIDVVTPFANEAVGSSDAINSFTLEKGLIDIPVSSEIFTIDIAKPFSDATSGSTDAAVIGFTKSVSDSLTAGEVLTYVMDWNKPQSDSVTTDDDVAVVTTWSRNFNETPVATEQFSRAITWDRTFTESAESDEAISINTGKGLTDTPSAADSGTGYVQDYTNPTYSDPGYTGSTFSFT